MKFWIPLSHIEERKGIYSCHADFQLDEGEELMVEPLGIYLPTPKGKIRKYHFQLVYHEEKI